MPVVDMSLEELKTYKGITPKPSDFDEYWERALKEMNDTNPNVTITPYKYQTPNVEYLDMYFDGTKNSRVYAKLLKPKHIDKKMPAVLVFHGYSGASPCWQYLLSLASLGYVVAALDCRGQGGKSTDVNPVCGNTLSGLITRGVAEENPDNLYFRNVFLDVAMLAKIVMGFDFVDESRVCATGGSQGGALTVACAALVPTIKYAAPQFPFLSDYKRVWEMDLTDAAYFDIKNYFRMFDPLHERENEFFTKLGYIDLQNFANRIKCKITFGTGLMDTVCPPSTQFAVYNKITSEKNMLLYPDFGHEDLPEFDDYVVNELIKYL